MSRKRKKKTVNSDNICAVFDALDKDDISTERIIAMTADTCGVEYYDVVSALAERHGA